ncbi:MAG: hypothetical protein IT582_10220 [Opitutaceae bacterium]|nr:hypothetical protein [Opitutaceae bacterium]
MWREPERKTMSDRETTTHRPDDRPSNEPQGSLPLAAGSAALEAAKEFCVYTRQEHSTEERLAQIIQLALDKKDAEIDALRDAIGALKDIVEQKRNDPERIAAIINGALRLPNVVMSHAVAWRRACEAGSVTSNRIGSIYLLGSVS